MVYSPNFPVGRKTAFRKLIQEPSSVRILLVITLLFAIHWVSGGPCLADDDLSNSENSSSLISSEALQTHTEVLADDALQGREAGQPGGHAAATYIRSTLAKLKLAPAGDDGSYFQAFGRGFRNIIAEIPGNDPSLYREYILLSAHYDHVGFGSKANSKGVIGIIHNGADDNASGVAAVLEAAKAIAGLGDLRRSVLVVFWDAEEKGLLGSKHWLEQPTIDVAAVRYLVNVDMVGRLRERLLLFGTRTMPGLRLAWSKANIDIGIDLDFPWEITNNSDHYTFFQKRIPVTMVHTGLHDDYHRSSDDVHLLNQQGIKQTAQLLVKIVSEMANQTELPRFRAASFNESAAAQKYFQRPYREQQRRLGLTVKPHEDDPSKGLKIEAVWVGSPANLAGVLPGMDLVSANDVVVESADELRAQIMKAKTSMTISLVDNGVPRDVVVPLAGKPQRVGVSWRATDAEPGVVMLSGVVRGSAADIAGCKPLDRVIRVGDQPVGDASEFRKRMSNLSGETELLLERNGKLMSVTLTMPDDA